MVELPSSCEHVWKWFIDLHRARSSNGFGINPISYSDTYSYFNLIGMQPDEWELDLIKIMDSKVLSIYAKEAEKNLNKK
jgi:hypothetical protein